MTPELLYSLIALVVGFAIRHFLPAAKPTSAPAPQNPIINLILEEIQKYGPQVLQAVQPNLANMTVTDLIKTLTALLPVPTLPKDPPSAAAK